MNSQDFNRFWATIMTIISSLLAFIMLLYLFTPVFDEWIIERSLKRLCRNLKQEFTGETFSPAYLCTFMDETE